MSQTEADRPQQLVSRTIVGLILAGALLWWFLRGVNLAAVFDRIAEARTADVAAAIALSLGGLLVRSRRWRYFVAPLKWIRFASLASAVFMGWTVTAILPGRLGEVARAVLLARREGIRASAVFGTVVLERLLDVLVVVLLLAAYLGFVRIGDEGPAQAFLLPALRTAAVVTVAALAAVAAFVVLTHRLSDPARSAAADLAGRVAGRPGRFVWRKLESFAFGVRSALGGRASEVTLSGRHAFVAIHTIILWTMICGVHLFLLRAFGIDASAIDVLPLIFLITLGIAVPVPAALGSYHAAVQFGLVTILGAPSDTAAAYAVVSHAIAFVPPVLIGALLLARSDLSLSTIIRTDP